MHAIVAGHRVRTQTNRHAVREHAIERRDSVTEFGVRDRAMHNARTTVGHTRQIFIVHANGVNEQWPACQYAAGIEQRDG